MMHNVAGKSLQRNSAHRAALRKNFTVSLIKHERVVTTLAKAKALRLSADAVSVIGAFYYLRIVKLMYFDAPGDLPVPPRNLPVRLALGANALAVLALGLLPGPLLDLCARIMP